MWSRRDESEESTLDGPEQDRANTKIRNAALTFHWKFSASSMEKEETSSPVSDYMISRPYF